MRRRQAASCAPGARINTEGRRGQVEDPRSIQILADQRQVVRRQQRGDGGREQGQRHAPRGRREKTSAATPASIATANGMLRVNASQFTGNNISAHTRSSTAFSALPK